MPPLFLYGLAFLVGVGFHFAPFIALSLLCPKERRLLALGVFLAGVCWNISYHPPEGTYEGYGNLKVHSISLKSIHGKPNYFFKGVLEEFKTGNSLYKHIPITFS